MSSLSQNCPRCNAIAGNSNRLVTDSCGHKKCKNCFLDDTVACLECSKQIIHTIPEKPLTITNTSNVFATKRTINHIKKIVNSLGKTEYTCTVCNKTFYGRSQQYYHTACGDATQKKYKCDQCQQSFSSRSHLNYHLQSHSATINSCSYCKKNFKNLIVLKKHVRQLHAQSAEHFPCNECNKSFKYKSSLLTHLEKHRENCRFACQLCDKKYAAKALLQQHMLKHFDKQHQCIQCGKRFQRLSTLKLHQKRHTKTECFICTICHKQYSDASVLLRHSKTHEDCTKYKCKHCDIIISRRDNILRHIRNTHAGESFKSCVEVIKDAALKQKSCLIEETPAIAVDCPLYLPQTVENSSVIKSVGNVQPIQIPQPTINTQAEHNVSLQQQQQQEIVTTATASSVLHKKLKKETENRALYLKILYPDVDDSEPQLSSADEEGTQNKVENTEQIEHQEPLQQQQKQHKTLLHWRKNVKYTYEHGDF